MPLASPSLFEQESKTINSYSHKQRKQANSIPENLRLIVSDSYNTQNDLISKLTKFTFKWQKGERKNTFVTGNNILFYIKIFYVK